MPANMTPEDFYRREAKRLRGLATLRSYCDVRDGLLRTAHEYEVMASQHEELRSHRFGQPLKRVS